MNIKDLINANWNYLKMESQKSNSIDSRRTMHIRIRIHNNNYFVTLRFSKWFDKINVIKIGLDFSNGLTRESLEKTDYYQMYNDFNNAIGKPTIEESNEAIDSRLNFSVQVGSPKVVWKGEYSNLILTFTDYWGLIPAAHIEKRKIMGIFEREKR